MARLVAVRPCIWRETNTIVGCAEYALPGRDYCAEHARARRPSPSNEVSSTWRWKKLRKAFVEKQPQPWVRGFCDKLITSRRDLEVDHVIRVADGGAPYDESNLRLSHRRCNRRPPPRPQHLPNAASGRPHSMN